ncbi:PEPxxWA-CTERM sorting domain-containing protein [uncultured Phenylobacterium sp.]|uniref:PEPxxWA-CTERM sorting domain-containing protein n=1 Tax=uncultured Phenylobacterium sp. TaxID=349273 RepID=UPI0025E2D1E4|nr:PEPxxWA-CTERM sorting domain-containing protein [uncultured Phenylobacterium sp.]
MAAAFALTAGATQAATYNLTLYGDLSQSSYGAFDSGEFHFDTWSLNLTGLELLDEPITVLQGDTINATVLFDGPFTMPASEILTSFAVFFGSSSFPAGDVKVKGPTTFLFEGNPVLASDPDAGTDTAGQIINGAVFFPPDNGEVIYDSFTSNFTITELHGPVTLEYVSAGYQLRSLAVPEPATWGMLILGFGGVGATMRSRRRLCAGVWATGRT